MYPHALMQGNPLQPLRIAFFGIDFPSHPRSHLPFIDLQDVTT